MNLARAGMAQRRYCAAFAARGAACLFNQRVYRPADGERGEQGQRQHHQQQQQGAAQQGGALAQQGLFDIGRSTHQQYGTEHAAVVHDGLRNQHRYMRAAADHRLQKIRRFVAAPAQQADRLSLQRSAHFLAGDQRGAKILAGGGDDDAVVIDHADAGQGIKLGAAQYRRQFVAQGFRHGVGGAVGHRRVGHRWPHLVVGQVELRAARTPGTVAGSLRRVPEQGIAVVERCHVAGCMRLMVAGEPRIVGLISSRDHRALRDQFRFGLADQRALVDAQHEDAAQRQHQHHQVDRQQDGPQAQPEQAAAGLAQTFLGHCFCRAACGRRCRAARTEQSAATGRPTICFIVLTRKAPAGSQPHAASPPDPPRER